MANRWLAVISLLGLAACSVDQRKLNLSDESGGSASGEPGEPSGAGAEAQPQASGGAAGSGGGLVDGCADLDTDGIADCESTLVDTPSFAKDVSGWAPVAGAKLAWDERNALTDEHSGSAKLSAGSPRATAMQCVPLEGEQLVIAYANALLAEATEGADAQLEVSFYAEPGCSGDRVGFFETPPNEPAESWTTVQAGGTSPENSRSMSIALVGVRGTEASSLTAYFDNVMLKAKAP